MPWFVYILECKDSQLYTGITNNLKRRIKDHNSGKGGRFTKFRDPVKLLYNEETPTKSAALKREAAIKRLTRKEKLGLIAHIRTLSPKSMPWKESRDVKGGYF